MLRIDIYISPSTIELENSRNPDTLSWDELLHWTFETRIDFIDHASGKSLLVLPEASLFQVLNGLSNARKQIVENGKTEITMRDREGSYDLSIKQKDESVEIRDEFSDEGFQVSVSDFVESTKYLIKLAIKEVEIIFPKLSLNTNYQKLKAIL